MISIKLKIPCDFFILISHLHDRLDLDWRETYGKDEQKVDHPMLDSDWSYLRWGLFRDGYSSNDAAISATCASFRTGCKQSEKPTL
jgi:hypothetical protein